MLTELHYFTFMELYNSEKYIALIEVQDVKRIILIKLFYITLTELHYISGGILCKCHYVNEVILQYITRII